MKRIAILAVAALVSGEALADSKKHGCHQFAEDVMASQGFKSLRDFARLEGSQLEDKEKPPGQPWITARLKPFGANHKFLLESYPSGTEAKTQLPRWTLNMSYPGKGKSYVFHFTIQNGSCALHSVEVNGYPLMPVSRCDATSGVSPILKPFFEDACKIGRPYFAGAGAKKGTVGAGFAPVPPVAGEAN